MKYWKHTLSALLLMGSSYSSPAFGDAEIAVIMNPGTSTGVMRGAELRPIFQTNRTAWKGTRVIFLNLPSKDNTRQDFDAAVLGLTPQRAARYWLDRKVRGGNSPPKDISQAETVVRLVALRKEAIGYVPLSAVTKDVKVVAKIRGGKVVAP